jgi:hypothetical protein
MRVLVAAIAVGLYSVGCLSLGMILLHVVRVNRAGGISVSASGYFGSAFAVGQGILGVAWQSITVMGCFSPGVVAGVLSALLLVTCGSGGRLRKLVRSIWGAASALRKEGIGWCAIAVLLIVLAVAIICLTSYPPMEDAEAFYLSLPRLFASTHRFSMLPRYTEFCQIGLGSEMHAGVYYSLVSPIYDEFAAELAAKLNVIPAIGAMCAVVWALTSRVGGGRRAQLLAVAMVLSSSMVWMIVLLSKSDLYPALLGVAAMYWLLLAGDLEDRVTLAMTGLLTGLAVSGKISYLGVMGPMLALLIAWQMWRRGMVGGITPLSARVLLLVRRYGILALWTLVGVAPLVIKNTLVFGQPLAPLVLIGALPNPLLHQTWFSPETTRWILATYPLALIYGKYPMQAGTLSALWLAFAPMILLSSWRKEWRRSESMLLAGAAVIGLLVWIILEPSVIAPRYYMPAVVVLIPTAAIATERAIRGGERKALSIAVILSTIAVLCMDIRSIAPYARWGRHYLSATSADWGREDAVWAALNTLNQMAGPGERVYLATYWSLQLRTDLIQCALRDQELEDLKRMKDDPVGLVAMLHGLGVRYIIQDTLTHADAVPAWDRLRDLSSGPVLSRQVFGPNNRIVVYTLSADQGSDPPHVRCAEIDEGIWRVVRSSGGSLEVRPK